MVGSGELEGDEIEIPTNFKELRREPYLQCNHEFVKDTEKDEARQSRLGEYYHTKKEILLFEKELIKIHFEKEDFKLNIIKRKALTEIKLLCEIARRRKRLYLDNFPEHKVEKICPLPSHFSSLGHDPFLETIFLDEDFMTWPNFLENVLKKNFPSLFYLNPDLKRLLHGSFEDDVTLESFAEALNGKFVYEFLKPFRLVYKDMDRALFEVNHRLQLKSDYQRQIFVCTPDNFYQTIITEDFRDIFEAALVAGIETNEIKGLLLIDAIMGPNPSIFELVFKLFNSSDKKSMTINYQVQDDGSQHDGMTPLHFAVLKNNSHIVSALLEKNCSIRHVDCSQTSVFQLACRLGFKDIFLLLIKYATSQGLSPADIINAPNKKGYTCLHEAAAHGKIGVAKILASYEGVDFEKRIATGKNAAQLAFSTSSQVMYEFIAKRTKNASL